MLPLWLATTMLGPICTAAVFADADGLDYGGAYRRVWWISFWNDLDHTIHWQSDGVHSSIAPIIPFICLPVVGIVYRNIVFAVPGIVGLALGPGRVGN